jgi:hypothetical protein
VVLDLIVISVAISLEPIPLTAYILVLTAERGIVKGLGFIFGWLFSFVVVIAGVLATTGGQPPSSGSTPSTAVLAVKLAIGVGLIAIGVRRHARRDRPKKPPTWMKRLDRLSIWTAAGLAVIVQPWVLVAAGAATVTEADLKTGATWAVLVVFCLLGSSVLIAMELYATFRHDAARARLTALREWIATHQDQAIVVLALLLGAWLMAKSIYGLVSA